MSSSQGKTRVEGAKRAEILAAATDRFGRDGYEHTKWADIAADVGVGPTALYHYFESKQHCLYEIMDEAIEDFRARFVAHHRRASATRVRALDAVMAELLRPLRARRPAQPRAGRRAGPAVQPAAAPPREEQARQAARSRMRELEFAWASFLARAMRDGAIPETDPRLLTRAVLGLYNSIWHWYRPERDRSRSAAWPSTTPSWRSR